MQPAAFFFASATTLEALRVNRAAFKVQWDAANQQLRRTGRHHRTVSFSLFFDRAIRIMHWYNV